MAAFRIPIKFDPTPVMYLVLMEKMIDKFASLVRIKPTENFFEMVREHVIDHAVNGNMPPAAISSAILNIADDLMAGRDVCMRAGDYISLMNFARDHKIV
jgi:hypothetical protein